MECTNIPDVLVDCYIETRGQKGAIQLFACIGSKKRRYHCMPVGLS